MDGDGVRTYWKEAQRRGMSLRAAARAAGIDGSVFCRALKGSYAGDTARLDEACLRALDAFGGPAVVPTSVVAGCRAACAAAFAAREVAMIWGPTQCGKTTALEQCCRENAEYRMFRFPATAGVPTLAAEIAKAYGVWEEGMAFRRARARILEAAPDTLLIADEVHEAFVAYGVRAAATALEFVREIHDRAGCGVVLCGTAALPRSMGSGQFAPVMRQTLERGLVRKAFSGRPPWRDVAAAARWYGCAEEPSKEERAGLQGMLAGMSFGAVMRLVRAAARMAEKRGRPMCWARIREALATLDQFAAPGGGRPSGKAAATTTAKQGEEQE